MSKKGKVIAVILLFIFTGVLMFFYHRGVVNRKMQEEIANEVIRLHVRANSDSEEDQALKLDVKEKIVLYLRGVMSDAGTVEEARQEIQSHLTQIEEIAKEEMERQGYDYEADATIGKDYFPIKEYGDMIFPAGEYEALEVNLGKSEGKNWWCVMYPTLCFVDSTYQTVPEQSKEKLKSSLTDEEYEMLLDGGNSVEYSSVLIEWFENTFFS